MSAEEKLYSAILTSPTGEILSWNAGCEDLFGIPAATALARPLTSLLDKGGQRAFAAPPSELPDLCDAHRVHVLRPDGSNRPAQLTLLPQHNGSGAVCCCIAFFMAEPNGSETERIARIPMRSVMDALPGIFYIVRADGTFALWNNMLELVAGMTSDEVRQSHALDMYDLVDRRHIEARLGEVFKHDKQIFIEVNYRDTKGNAIPYLLCGARIECMGRYYLCGMGLDISDLRAKEQVLRLYERALNATSSGLVITRCGEHNCPIEYVNPAFERIAGYAKADALGRDPRFMAADGMDEDQRAKLREAIDAQREVNVVFRNRRKSGEIFWNHLTVTPVADEGGKVTHFIGVLSDVTAERQRTATLEHEVNHDALTGLANRTLLWDRLEQAIHMSQRNKSMVATVLMDLNGFKQINDTYGHEAGDQVLTVVARRLQASVRDSDTVARLSGDEFVLILTNQPSLRYTLRMIERVRASMAMPVVVEHAEIEVGASMGVSVYPHDGPSAADLMRAADVAMYHAKASGRKDVHFFSADMKTTTEAKQKLEHDLLHALEDNELFLLYQPRMCLRSGRVSGLEALLRWRHPERGVVLPSYFLADAEESGLINRIGEQVVEQAALFISAMKAAGIAPLPLSMNVSFREYSTPHFVQRIGAMLSRHGLDPQHLIIELREDGLNGNQQIGLQVLSQLRDLGVQRALDGFGGTMSDLNYLQQLPLTHAKIDAIAIRNIAMQPNGGAVAKSLIDIGHNLGLYVTAKEVETRLQLNYLQQHGCDEMQGLLFSQPLGAEAVTQMLAAAPPP